MAIHEKHEVSRTKAKQSVAEVEIRTHQSKDTAKAPMPMPKIRVDSDDVVV